MSIARVGLLVAATMLSLLPTNGAAQTFQSIGDLEGGEFESVLFGISGDGHVAVGHARSERGMEAVAWRDGNLVPLGDQGGGAFGSFARAASYDGRVIVGAGNWGDVAPEATRWDGGLPIGMGYLADGTFSQAWDVSGNGEIIVGNSTLSSDGSPAEEAFRWESNEMTPIGFLDGTDQSNAFGVSATGMVIVGVSISSDPNGRVEAFRWESGVMEGLGVLGPGGTSVGKSVSANGKVVVGYSSGLPPIGNQAFQAFRWESGVMIGLGAEPGGNTFAYANAVSADGSVVVGEGDTQRECCSEAYIWDALHGSRKLQDALHDDYGIVIPGWQLLEATDVSANGKTIVGYGRNPDGSFEGWVVNLPEPSSAMIAIAGFVIFAVRQFFQMRSAMPSAN